MVTQHWKLQKLDQRWINKETERHFGEMRGKKKYAENVIRRNSGKLKP